MRLLTCNTLRNRFAVLAATCLVGTLSLMPTTAHAQTWDLYNDFSTTNNPNGAWTYGAYTDAAHTVFSIYPSETSNILGPEWYGFVSDINPNTSGSGAFGISPGTVSLASDSGTPVARWTAPTTGIYTIDVAIGGSASVGGPGTGNANARISGVNINGVAQNGSYNSGTNVYTWQLDNLSLNMGSIVDAYVNEHFLSGNTQTIFTVTQQAVVPEPGMMAALVAVALTGGGLLARRKRIGETF